MFGKMFGYQIMFGLKFMFGTKRQLFLMYRAEHNFGAEYIVPKLNGAEVRIPQDYWVLSDGILGRGIHFVRESGNPIMAILGN